MLLRLRDKCPALTGPLCQIDPIEYVEDICENMQLFPKEDFLTGDQLLFEFNPEVSRHLIVDHDA